MRKYFDETIDRNRTFSYKWDERKRFFDSDEVLPMWVADMDFRSPKPVVDALIKRAEHGVYGYSSSPNSYDEAVVSWLEQRHRWKIEKEWLSYSPGVMPTIGFLISCLTEPGDKVVLQSPVYYPFFDVINRSGRVIVDNALILEDNTYKMDLDKLEYQLDSSVKMLLLCSPHNPVGRVWTKDELVRLGEICIKHNIIIVADEIHADLVFKQSKHIPLATISEELAQQTITCIAPSKTFNIAGLQASSVIISNADLRLKFRKEISRYSLNMMNTFGRVAAEASYKQGGEWLDQCIDYIYDNNQYVKQYVETNMPLIKVIQSEGTYLVWLDCRKLGMNGQELREFMLKKAKVALSDGFIFGENGDGFTRMNIGCPREMLVEGLERIKSAYISTFK
ncbi:MalY/PatB family protein [Chengkuizengella sediminis]|uniref:MalY/PatB family protein n=1 Tax=Chengkuizengella sediminis TaxID=1885917 RepID=UPI00138A535E|nr:MalY/PatB family protein [Chengkuizengella sediminis]NDI36160.1 pyridoxal phosphate-dependent aminotransferase [Chengkuizengella sediminis]